MSAPDPPRIVAAIAHEDQRAAMAAAAEMLSRYVGFALGADWPVFLRLIAPDDAEIPPGVVLVAALLEDSALHDPIASTRARWAARIGRYRAAGHDRVLLCNLFRRVEDPTGEGPGVEQIRRLNRMAIDLSREFGVEIVDIDRLFALCGGRSLDTDYRGGGGMAPRLAGHAIANAILQGEMGGCLDAGVQARASAAHGGEREILRLVERQARPGGRP